MNKIIHKYTLQLNSFQCRPSSLFGTIFAYFHKNKNMKHFTIIFFCLFVAKISCAQVVYKTTWQSEASHKVYVTDWKSEANLVVYVTTWKSEAEGKKGTWYFTEWKSEAEWVVYFTKWKSEADIIVYFTNWKSEAGGQ